MTTALVDADILAYQAAAASEQPIKWDDDIWTLHAFESDGERRFDEMLENITAAVEADKVVLALSDTENWRKGVLPTYKSNRAATRKPLLLKHLKERALEKYDTILRPTLEGDDCLGILGTMKKTGDCIICSIDKDFKSIPGRHYNFGRKEFFEVTPQQADYWHMMQTLTGDTTDGYTGCPGIGQKTAEKILQAALAEGTPWATPAQLRELYWQHVVKAYAKAGLSEEEALTQARVARICRSSDYDFKTKQVILWSPHNE